MATSTTSTFRRIGSMLTLALGLTAVAYAQPAPGDAEPKPPEAAQPQASDATEADASATSTDDAAPTPPPPSMEIPPETSIDPTQDIQPYPRPPAQAPLRILPDVIAVPTGHMLPAGTVQARASADTAGTFSGELRVGMGDVAEVGLGTTDLTRLKGATSPTKRLNATPVATFRMGLAERKYFRHQPALMLGFHKSFERTRGELRDQVTAVSLVATKTLGPAQLTLGTELWDATLTIGETRHALNTQGPGKQARPLFGLVVQATDSADIMIDTRWTPVYCPSCIDTPAILLKPTLAWGVRYFAAPWLRVESGVRVADIQAADLMSSEIFAQLVVVNQTLRRHLPHAK